MFFDLENLRHWNPPILEETLAICPAMMMHQNPKKKSKKIKKQKKQNKMKQNGITNS